LVAYVVGRDEVRPGEEELRAYLRERLPEYMAPGRIALLESLPLTPNGKVDRKALPEPEAKDGVASGGYVGPRTAVEELVSGIFAEVLKREQVGINEDFFEAGGHSLLATQVVARIRQVLQIELPLQRFFEAPTVAKLSATMISDPLNSAKIERANQ